MTLEELKAAWDAAALAAKADEKDKKLQDAAEAAKVAYEEAKAKSEEPLPQDDPSAKWDAETKAYVEKLRKENATHRNKNKELASSKLAADDRLKAVLKAAGIEDDSEKPEEKVKTLTAQSQTLAFRNAILESAVEQGIPKESLEFYEFLVAKAAGGLKEGEELSDEQLAEIVGKVKLAGGKKSANSSVTTGAGKGDPNPASSGEVTYAKFVKMSITEKSNLFLKNPDLYKTLMEEAKSKKQLV